MKMHHIAGAVAVLLLLAPTGAHAQAAAEVAAPPSRQSWTADRREFAVGDIVTVMVDEHTLASANHGDFASDRRSRDMRLGVSQNVVTGGNVGVDIGSRNDADSRRSGQSTRQNRFRGELTTRVVEIGPDGMLRLEGSKVVEIDGNSERLSLAGWARPQDVGRSNLIDSWRVADAALLYSSDSDIAKPKGGIIGRMFGWIWP